MRRHRRAGVNPASVGDPLTDPGPARGIGVSWMSGDSEDLRVLVPSSGYHDVVLRHPTARLWMPSEM
jgi:hypothetical protein